MGEGEELGRQQMNARRPRKRKQVVFIVMSGERGEGGDVDGVFRSMVSAEKFALMINSAAPTSSDDIRLNAIKSWGRIDQTWIIKKEVK